MKKSKQIDIGNFVNVKNVISGKKIKNIAHMAKLDNTRKVTKGVTSKIFLHISNNIKEYIVVSLFFVIGVITGVVAINNSNQITQQNIQGYIQTFIEALKNNEYKVDMVELLETSVISNIKLVVIIWFVGSTVIGMPLIYGIVAFRGCCLGYTIAAIIATLGTSKGVVFVLSALLFQNILIIPGIFALSISGIRLYKAIVHDRHKENIKTGIYKHSIFSVITLLYFIVAAVVETFVSGNLIMLTARYI